MKENHAKNKPQIFRLLTCLPKLFYLERLGAKTVFDSAKMSHPKRTKPQQLWSNDLTFLIHEVKAEQYHSFILRGKT